MKDLLSNFIATSAINFINTNSIKINHIIYSIEYYMPYYEDRMWTVETDIREQDKHYESMMAGYLFNELEKFNDLFNTDIKEFKINFLLEDNMLKEIYNIEIDMREKERARNINQKS